MAANRVVDDHAELENVGDNTHEQIDAHMDIAVVNNDGIVDIVSTTYARLNIKGSVGGAFFDLDRRYNNNGAGFTLRTDGTINWHVGNNNVSGEKFHIINGSFNSGNERITIDGNLVGVHTTSPTARLDVDGNTIRLRTLKTPASATADGNQGDICWDNNYLYMCIGINEWKRAALSTW